MNDIDTYDIRLTQFKQAYVCYKCKKDEMG